MLGVRYDLGEIYEGDTAELRAALREKDKVVEEDEIAVVAIEVQRPNGTLEGPTEAEIEENGEGYLRYTETTEQGNYLAKMQFTLLTGEIRSRNIHFTVVNPFQNKPSQLEEVVIDETWLRLEDCFDSLEGGPWLKDETLAGFNRRKVARYIPEVLLDINVQMPPTEAVLGDFANITAGLTNEQNPNLPLISKGLLCKTIQHLVRSYAEQPVPQGGQVVYHDRTRYVQTWQVIYQSEHEDYYTMVRLWKRKMLNYGRSALLVSSKAGRLYFAGSMLRTRNIGRGYY